MFLDRDTLNTGDTLDRNHLVLESVLFPAVLLDLGVDVLHQAVPLHQHVRERGTCEDPHNLPGVHARRVIVFQVQQQKEVEGVVKNPPIPTLCSRSRGCFNSPIE